MRGAGGTREARTRRWARRLAWALAAPLVLVLLLRIAMGTAPVRRAVREAVLDLVDEVLVGEIRARELRTLSFGRVEFRGVSLHDDDGRTLATIETLTAVPDWSMLVRGEIGIADVHARGVTVDLGMNDAGDLYLVEAVLPVPDDAPEEPEDDDEPLVVAIGSIRIDDAEVTFPLGEGEPPLRAEGLHAVGSLRVDADVAVDVHEVGARLYRGEVELAELRSGSGRYDDADDGLSRVEVALGGGEDDVRAEASLRMHPDAPADLTGRVELAPLTTRALRALGEEELADALVERVEGELVVGGTLDAPTAEAHLRAGDARLDLEARRAEEGGWQTTVCGADLALGDLYADLPDMTVDACVDATLGDATPSGRPLSVRVREAAIDGTALPPIEARTTLAEDRVAIENLAVLHPGGRGAPAIEASGVVGFDGAVDVRVRTRGLSPSREVILAELAPGIDGVVDADARVRVSPGAGGAARLGVSGHVRVRDVSGPGFAVRSIELEARSRGAGTRQRITFAGDLEELRLGDMVFSTGTIRIEGGPEEYRLVVDLRSDRGIDVHLELEALVEGDTWNVTGGGELVRGDRDWQLGLALLKARQDGTLEVTGLRLARRDGSVDIDGSLRAGGRVEARIAFVATSFAELAFLAVGDDFGLEGEVDGSVALGGDTRRPTARADLRIREAGGLGYAGIGGRVAVGLHRTGGEVDIDLDIGSGGHLAVDGEASWSARGPLGRALPRATVDGRVDLDALDLALVDRIFGLNAGIGGRLGADVAVDGPVTSPRLQGAVTGTDLVYGDLPPLGLRMEAQYAERTTSVRLGVDDPEGPLLTAELEAELEDILQGTLDDPLDAPFRLRVALPSRRLADLPLAPEILDANALEVEARAELAHEAEGRLTFTASARVDGDPMTGELADERCQSGAPFHLRAVLASTSVGLDLVVDGRSGERPILDLRASVPADLEAWLHGALPASPPPLDADLRLDQLDLASVPLVCTMAQGHLTGSSRVRSLFTEAGSLTAGLETDDVRLGGSPPLPIEVDLEVDASRVGLRAASAPPGGGRMALSLEAPWEIGEDGAPRMGDAPLSATLRFRSYSLEPWAGLLGLTPGRAGTLHGEVTTRGPLDALDTRGRLRIVDASVFVPYLDQRLDRVTGAIRFDPARITLESLHARDRSGRLEAAGEVELRDHRPVRFRLDLKSRAFPVRRAGIVLSYITGETHLRGTHGEDGWDSDLVLEDFAVRLPLDTDFDVQELDDHPEVEYLASLDEAPEDPAVAFVDTEPAPGVVVEGGEEGRREALVIHMRTENPFWVRREDFAIRLSLRIETRVDANGFAMHGVIRTERGFLELLGRTFDVRRGTITFTEGSIVDPLLDLYATHDLASAPGKKLGVRIRGFASRPELTFLDPDEVEITAGEAIQWMTTGSGSGFNESFSSEDSASAAQQATSVIAGLTAGVLTTAARHGMGDNVPTISVNTGARAADVQLRAGFDANRLIPEAMERFVTGLFIQGFIGTASSESEGGQERSVQATGGFGVELYHPHNLVTSGQYEPPANWSLDILWRP